MERGWGAAGRPALRQRIGAPPVSAASPVVEVPRASSDRKQRATNSAAATTRAM